MENFNLKLKRSYALYLGESDTTVIVSKYNDSGKLIEQVGLSEKELSFIQKLVYKNQGTDLKFNSKLMTKKILKFNLLPFEIIWIVPEKIRKIKTTKKTLDIKFPNLIFMVTNDVLEVFHYYKKKDKYLLHPATNIPNVFEDHVCLGNVEIKKREIDLYDEINKWESYFFDSVFTSDEFFKKTFDKKDYIKTL